MVSAAAGYRGRVSDRTAAGAGRSRLTTTLAVTLIVLGLGLAAGGALGVMPAFGSQPPAVPAAPPPVDGLPGFVAPEWMPEPRGSEPVAQVVGPTLAAARDLAVPTSEGSTAASDDTTQFQVADPVRIVIPTIGVDADVIPLGTDDRGELEVPQDFAQTGWWRDGPEPGEDGPAVIVGHVDSYRGPAVFFDLAQLQRGDPIYVERQDGTRGIFLVSGTVAVSKAGFPTDAVYGDTDGAELRLITCHGAFTGGSYDGNLIVFARELV